eukprot:3161640-Alexandrium_andersonii.AAC.1
MGRSGTLELEAGAAARGAGRPQALAAPALPAAPAEPATEPRARDAGRPQAVSASPLPLLELALRAAATLAFGNGGVTGAGEPLPFPLPLLPLPPLRPLELSREFRLESR